MRVLMTGGGTGGHVNPAIAIANTIKKHDPSAVIEFVASSGRTDKACDLVPRAGYILHKLDVCASYSIIDLRNIKTVYYMIKSERQARELIESFRPDVIVGTGGYACYPLLSAGAKLGIPTLVHESNAKPGRAVRRLARKIDCVMTNFEMDKNRLPGARRILNVGNPTLFEGDITAGKTTDRHNDGYLRRVVSFGGSGGSLSINREMLRILPHLAEKYPQVQFYHASGKRDYEWMKQGFDESGLSGRANVTLVEYIYDMHERMAGADLLICRAGAMTISEVALMGKAAIFVPFPDAAANHQYENAKRLSDGGACELVTEDDFPKDALAAAIEKLISDDAKRREYGENVKKFARQDANELIYQEIMRAIKG